MGIGNSVLKKLCIGLLAFLPGCVLAGPIVTKVAGGYYHCIFVKSDGSLWGMGDNTYGQLGDGSSIDRHSPIRIVLPPPSPVLISFNLSGNNAVFNGTNGMLGGTYYTLMSTNMMLPVTAPWASNSLSFSCCTEGGGLCLHLA